MHAVRRLRHVYHSIHILPNRTLTTRPNRIPSFVNSWDPSKYASSPPKSLAERSTYDATEGNARRASRESLRDSQHVIISQGYTAQSLSHRYATKRLNHWLSLAETDGPNHHLRTKLWRAYALAKAVDPDIIHIVPDRAWDVIWNCLSLPTLQTRTRTRRLHLEELYRDMHTVGRHPTVRQRIMYLESMFYTGKEDQALAEWEEDHTRSDMQRRQDYKPEHLESGAKMYAYVGQVDRALAIMEELYHLYPSWDSAVMVAVFRAHTSSPSATHHQTAQAIYLRLKKKLGNEITLNDYDCCLVGFLEARLLHHAKQVFKDMITGGHLASNFSQDEVTKVLRRLHLLYRLGTDIHNMTSIALQAISVLPISYHSHLFGDWMKLAVSRKAPKVAAQILEMMFSRGHVPETLHFNMLLKVLFRTKDRSHQLKAENIGWQMMEELSKSLPTRSHQIPATNPNSRHAEEDDSGSGKVPSLRVVPRANNATFALLMKHHGDHAQWEHVDYLTRRMNEYGISANDDVMNVLMENQCRQGKYHKVWEIYRSLTNGDGGTSDVFPNGATFRCLWRTLRFVLGDHATRDDGMLPSPRQLLAENLKWWDLVRSRFDAERFRIGIAAADHGALNSLIMHCFSYTKDLPGSLVAMHALRKRFNIFPSNKAAQILQKHIAWVDMQRESPSVRSQYSHSGVHQKKIEKMGVIYHVLQDARFKRKNITGDQYAYMSEDEIADLGLNMLSEFVRVILKRQHPPEDVEAMISEAKKEIGLPDMSTGDMTAFEVV